jgi:hypothetical protein
MHEVASPLTDELVPFAEFLLTGVLSVAHVGAHLEARRLMRSSLLPRYNLH